MAEPRNETGSIGCHWHPTVQTRLSCSQCQRPICTDCLVQVPVGIRCRECGRAQPLPTFDVRPASYARATITAAIIAIAGVVLTILVAQLIGGLAFVVMPLAIGYATGEIVSRVVNLKRSRGLMYITGGTVALAVIVSLFLLDFRLLELWGVLATVGGVMVAIARVRL